MVNEFDGRVFACAAFVPSGPGYDDVPSEQRVCAVQGSVPGSDTVSGTAYLETAFRYQYSKRWSNYGVIVGLTLVLFIAHLVMSEIVASERSKGEVLVFQRTKMKTKAKCHKVDEESGNSTAHDRENIANRSDLKHAVEKQVSIFHWESVNYEVQIKGETRKILENVDGWIKPGTLTALMVESFFITSWLEG